jgi:hypothetical protein
VRFPPIPIEGQTAVHPTQSAGGQSPSSIVTVASQVEAQLPSQFWQRAAATFRRLQPPPPKPGEPAHYSDNGLCAYWSRGGRSAGWTAECTNSGGAWRLGNADDQIKTLFRFVAERAAVELGQTGGDSAVCFWLDRLREEGLFFKLDGIGGEIYRVCHASAEYCLKCESTMLIRNRQSTVGKKPTARKGGRPVFLVDGGRIKELRASTRRQHLHASARFLPMLFNALNTTAGQARKRFAKLSTRSKRRAAILKRRT